MTTRRLHSRREYLAAGLGTRTDAHVARVLGVTDDAATAMRRRLGIPHPARARRRALLLAADRRHEGSRQRWASVDWTQPRTAIAEALGVSPHTVYQRASTLRAAGIDIPRLRPGRTRRGAATRGEAVRESSAVLDARAARRWREWVRTHGLHGRPA